MAERDIVAAILRLLKKTPDCFAWKEHGGMYGTAGIPDIIACIGGRFVAFEVKTAGGRGTAPRQIIKAARDHDTKNQERKRTSLQSHFGGRGRRHTQGIGGCAL